MLSFLLEEWTWLHKHVNEKKVMINTHARKHTFILQGSPDHTPLAGETIVDRTEIIFPLLKVVDHVPNSKTTALLINPVTKNRSHIILIARHK